MFSDWITWPILYEVGSLLLVDERVEIGLGERV